MGCCASQEPPKENIDESENQGMLEFENVGEGGYPTTRNKTSSSKNHSIIGIDSDDDEPTTKRSKNRKKNNKNNNDTTKKKQQQPQPTRYKILLLGPGMSGKTTLFKQMKKLHGPQYTQKDFVNCKTHLTANLIESFRKLCIYSDILAEQHKSNNDNNDNESDTKSTSQSQQETEKEERWTTRVLSENRAIRDKVARLNDRAPFDDKLYRDFTVLLKDPGIQKTLDHRYQFQLNDNFDYLIKHMDKYCKPQYIPTFEDYLNVKQRTVGIQKLTFSLPAKHGNDQSMEHYDIHDAGGQRTERKKWMHVIQNATAFMFVAAISGYNQSLWEEPSYNRMKEAIHLFRRIYHMDALKRAHVILFLNKVDLFDKKVTKYSIKEQFPEYKGKETPDDVKKYIVQQFKHQMDPKYALHNNGYVNANNSDSNNNNNVAEEDVNDASNGASNRSLYHHFTCATDTECVNRVFELTRDILVYKNLSHMGFL